MKNDQWTNRLSEYIDGELDSTERAAIEAHLATCGHCYATLGELRQVVARAKQLEDTSPATDLWAGIATEIRRGSVVDRPVRRDRRRFSLTVPQLLAASVALILLSGGSVWLALQQRPTNTAAEPVVTTQPSTARVANWTGSTDVAIAELQAALAQNEKRLDSTTVRIVRKNLAIIDRAIADARIALRNDPGNAYLNLHLADTMRRKVELLRRVNDLAAARS
jgi:anti-sigma factor RsiW